MATFSLFLAVGYCALWGECVLWYRRPRGGFKRGINLTVVIILGIAAPYITVPRALAWSTRNGHEWLLGPILGNAKWRWGQRRQRRKAQRTPVGGAITQALPAGRPVLQLPAGPQPATPVAAGAGEMVSSPDGTVCMVTPMSDGSQLVTPLLRGPS